MCASFLWADSAPPASVQIDHDKRLTGVWFC
jgi:hypothetical protein